MTGATNNIATMENQANNGWVPQLTCAHYKNLFLGSLRTHFPQGRREGRWWTSHLLSASVCPTSQPSGWPLGAR